MARYKQRIADSLLSRKLEGKGAIVIEGPKWCGKTTTAEKHSRSTVYVISPEEINYYRNLIEVNPRQLLEGPKPRMFDEWQNIPKIWDAIRYDVDHSGQLGQYILTGSTIPLDLTDIHHSGTGRFGWLRMNTMSLWESGESSGEVSLKRLFDGEESSGKADMAIERLAFVTCRGGWPLSIGMSDNTALEQAFDYVDAVVRKDISLTDGKSRDTQRVRRLMRSLARHQGSQISFANICRDLQANEGGKMNEETVSAYITALRNIFVIDDVKAWNPNLRSATAMRTLDTRYFTDPSIATAALGLGPKDLLNDLNTFGLILETLCIRDLRVYAQPLNGEVYHYRDKNGLECDAVIHLRDGRYALIEVKLGGEGLINEGIDNLKKLQSKIDTGKMKEPAFMMVLTGVGKYAYRNSDGIHIVPIGCLKD